MDGAPLSGSGQEADPAVLLARADEFRDARDWVEAAIGYAAYLKQMPADWPIWVQYGHCMKESGDVQAALLLYREAERRQPGDADLHVQIGHALKLLGRVEEAYQSYARALTLDPDSPAARAELLAAPGGQAPPPATPPALAVPRQAPPAAPHRPAPTTPAVTHPVPQAGPPASGAASAALAATRDAPPPPPPPPATPAAAPPAADPEPEAGAMVLDASDLIDFFRHNRAPTGIQRVQLGILGSMLEQAPDSLLAVFEPASGAWKRLPRATFDTLAALSRAGADPADPAWTAAMTAALAALLQAPGLRFPPGGALVNLGTSWWIPDYLRRVREAKAAAPGLRYIPFLHDCIPLIVPEHCAAGLVDEFARWFAGLCLHADHVLCNSSCTEADFHRLSAALLPPGAPRIPTGLVRLDARTRRPRAGRWRRRRCRSRCAAAGPMCSASAPSRAARTT